MRHLLGFIGTSRDTRQFLASQDLIVDMIFECLEFLVEVRTEENRIKNEKVPQKTEKYPKKTEKKTRRLPQILNLGLSFFSFFFGFQPYSRAVATCVYYTILYTLYRLWIILI